MANKVWFIVILILLIRFFLFFFLLARRTKSSSPLGQLFDHGCDAFGTMPLALAICSALSLGPTVLSITVCATIQIPFFTSQFEEKYAHTVRTQVGYNCYLSK